MLAHLSKQITEGVKISIKKMANGEDTSLLGAFPISTQLSFKLKIPRKLGIVGAEMHISNDTKPNEPPCNIQLIYETTLLDADVYAASVCLKTLCEGDKSGLFYYNFSFSRGDEKDMLFSDTRNNLDIELSQKEGRYHRLLVYENGFDTPEWFHKSIMYHIFVDRFFRGSKKLPCREDAEINQDWENGIPEYAEQNGGFVKNNVFFGGTLFGVKEKLDYLKSLGVGVIYLSPIFRAYSNHKYDTGDYMQVDEMFGGDEALSSLISEANKLDIKIILDGVFNHTGDNSLYFNKYGKYPSVGAYQSESSPYRNWYSFSEFPNKYDAWWGIPILPKLCLSNEECKNYLAGEDSVVEKYTKMGIGGWRLDVADELSDDFLDLLRKTAKSKSVLKEGKEQTVIIGEVWENAADKVAYGKRRRYLRGSQLDSVMNYPFKNAVVEYLLHENSQFLADTLTELYASYPKCVSDALMNILGTHDTERILTVLGGENKYGLQNSELAKTRMSAEQRKKAISRLRLASTIQYTVYGIPSVFYGDEAGIEGYHDPFCRMPYPWGREEKVLVEHYKKLGQIRSSEDVFNGGFFRITKNNGALLVYEREKKREIITVAINASEKEIELNKSGLDLLSNKRFDSGVLPPLSAVILKN